MKDSRAFAALLDLAHGHSSDPWFRVAILSSVADSASPFFHATLAKGESWTDPQLLVELSALIGARQNGNEIGRWFSATPKMSHPDKALEGLTRGLRPSTAR